MALTEGTKFWLVWSPRGWIPKKKWPTKDQAEAEATRLSEQLPGRHFYVLEHVGFAMVGPEIPTEYQRRQAEIAAQEACKPPAASV